MVDDNYSKLLCHFDGADGSTTFIDESGKTITAVGNVQIDTSQSVFGGASCLFDGSGDRLQLFNNADFDFGSGDFTIDFRIRFADISGVRTIIGKRGNSSSYGPFLILYNSASGTLNLYMSSNGSTWDICEAQAFLSPDVDTWYHIALVRNGTNIRVYVNGTYILNFTSSATVVQNSYKLSIGCDLDDQYGFSGWLDELRISKGIARWTANFTPPAQAYGPNDSSKMFLVF